ncbi:hypothetical protein B0H19DRAFT_1097625 [Mycena capillaripes]|nr:hypothetical protein B0H19DRAFT_1097625 [Mycena capillaripes]
MIYRRFGTPLIAWHLCVSSLPCFFSKPVSYEHGGNLIQMTNLWSPQRSSNTQSQLKVIIYGWKDQTTHNWESGKGG